MLTVYSRERAAAVLLEKETRYYSNRRVGSIFYDKGAQKQWSPAYGERFVNDGGMVGQGTLI